MTGYVEWYEPKKAMVLLALMIIHLNSFFIDQNLLMSISLEKEIY